MKAELSAWLISSAEKLRAGVRDELDIENLLNGFGIRMICESSTKRSGALAQDGDGKWFVIVRGQRKSKKWTAVDRFTAAHELGHYLLEKEWGFSPSFADKKNYYDCESLCNQFAAYLLVDYNAVLKIVVESPQMCLGVIRDLAKRYGVSIEVVSRAIVETHPGIAICAFAKGLDRKTERLWGLSSLNEISPRYGRKIVRAKSIQEEVLGWSHKLLAGNLGVQLDFATESTEPVKNVSGDNNGKVEDKKTSKEINYYPKAALAVVMKKPPVDV